MINRTFCALGIALVAAGCGAATDHGPLAAADLDSAAPLGIVVVTAVAARAEPDDWIEVTNASATSVELDDYVFVDREHDLDRARRFTGVKLAPGERHTQRISTARNGFALGRDEAVWIYRAADGRVSDVVDWAARDVAASPVIRIERALAPVEVTGAQVARADTTAPR